MEEKNSYDSFKEVTEFQNNLYNPGHYIGTGRVPPIVSAPGNALPMAIFCFFAALVLVALCCWLFFSDVIAIVPFLKSELAKKILASLTMLVISAFFVYLGIVYLKKAKIYYKQKSELLAETLDNSDEDRLWQRTCPNCNKHHDIDYPKCPYCNFNYFDN